jgi:hypothetical protein
MMQASLIKSQILSLVRQSLNNLALEGDFLDGELVEGLVNRRGIEVSREIDFQVQHHLLRVLCDSLVGEMAEAGSLVFDDELHDERGMEILWTLLVEH